MLSTNVLCIKKRKKKRSYCIASEAENGPSSAETTKRSGAATMLQITEDTPPDMLAGAMDLTVHLPSGRSVKMSVERSTPMMDLLVQITTNYHLQLSGYTLQALGMAPSNEHSDSILPYKPNTPIGALDTQHIRVIPKARNASVPKNVPPGHQPFESTFRLKVHLPRNQLFVTRVSQSVHLGDIMKKVCEEKNLDTLKYEFRHPENLDEILDPKLSLSDYAITEIFLVQRGSSLSQSFVSSGDIMSQERKQAKTGGGVFNLIFRRGKSSSGSLSSENRSISPTHSDDSRSVTPPGVQQIIAPPPKEERPKPPQRKRRPAPKPPVETNKKSDTLTICHSRNSSDSSGYHEASVLSDNFNASLPRRPKSTAISEETQKAISHQHSQSTSNLSKMSAHSRSTSSLALPSRKKKTAPPPPPVLKTENTETSLEEPSPVVASHPCTVAQTEIPGSGRDNTIANTNPMPTPRNRIKIPAPLPRTLIPRNSEERRRVDSVREEDEESDEDQSTKNREVDKETLRTQASTGSNKIEDLDVNQNTILESSKNQIQDVFKDHEKPNMKEVKSEENLNAADFNENIEQSGGIGHKRDETFIVKEESKDLNENIKQSENIIHESEKTLDAKESEDVNEDIKQKVSQLSKLQKQAAIEIFNTTAFSTDPDKVKPPEIVALHPKSAKKDRYPKSMFDSYSRKRGFQIGASLLDMGSDEESSQMNSSGLSTPNSITSALNAFDFVDEIDDLDVKMFTESLSKNSKNKSVILNQLHGMHELDRMKKNTSGGSLRSVRSLPGFLGGNIKKWSNVEELDDISLHSHGRSGWVIGDTSDTESTVSTTNTLQEPPPEILNSVDQPLPSIADQSLKEVGETDAEVKNTEDKKIEVKDNELEADWQYQLPSPPKAFRDSSPITVEATNEPVDSVVTSPELFEKLKVVKDKQSEKETVSDVTSMVSEEEKPILNKLSLENLEKRKSLVYNRELATSLKMQDEERKTDSFASSLVNFEKTYDEIKKSSPKQASMTSTLPNFKITTYNTKPKLDIFEDDTVRSNTDRVTVKRNSIAESTFPLQRSSVGHSMENISFRKNSLGKTLDEESNRNRFHPKPVNVFRSESFSKEQTWVPSRPVTRSKSQVALNKYKETKNVETNDEMSKSNSLFDVSGLQSLGVMRLIQNKLNTPNNSLEELDKEESSYHQRPEIKTEVQKVEEKPVKTYKYTPPSINMGTWSERPKIPVNVKEDPDYKYSVKDTTNSTKVVVNNMNNARRYDVETRSNFSNSINLRVGQNEVPNKNRITVNGFEPVQNSGNVLIKIGGTTNNNKPLFRKPLGNINSENQRPHSIAFGSDFDISRVPIVRSVEFKRPYKDFQSNTTTVGNTSVTQIFPDSFSSTRNANGDVDKSKERLAKPQVEPKPVFRVNSYLQNTSAPVVRGFRNSNETNRISWNQPHSFSTLPAKPAKNFSLNAPIPFSQSNNLRKVESKSFESKKMPPPAPLMPKTFQAGNVKNREIGGDPKEQLLQAIRDFGGKKGLRAVKA